MTRRWGGAVGRGVNLRPVDRRMRRVKQYFGYQRLPTLTNGDQGVTWIECHQEAQKDFRPIPVCAFLFFSFYPVWGDKICRLRFGGRRRGEKRGYPGFLGKRRE